MNNAKGGVTYACLKHPPCSDPPNGLEDFGCTKLAILPCSKDSRKMIRQLSQDAHRRR